MREVKHINNAKNNDRLYEWSCTPHSDQYFYRGFSKEIFTATLLHILIETVKATSINYRRGLLVSIKVEDFL